jgi:BirA family biotin operon repressor/biotin-[acetyl-CoA-carboxylase] ligase
MAPPGSSLLLSVLLRPPAAVAEAVTMVAGLAMAEAVEAVAGVDARLKWPNDLVVGDDRKLAGILAEADWPAAAHSSAGWSPPAPEERVVVVVGIGVNVNWPTDVPDELADLLVACNHVAGHDVDRAELLAAFLHRLDARYTALRAGTVPTSDWRARSATLGRRVRVDLGSDDVVGTAVDIDAAGRLVVETLEGDRRTFAVGDVTHLRVDA